MFFVERHKAQELGVEVELNFADRAMAVFGEDEFGDISRYEVVIILLLIIGAMEEHDEVGVLLD